MIHVIDVTTMDIVCHDLTPLLLTQFKNKQMTFGDPCGKLGTSERSTCPFLIYQNKQIAIKKRKRICCMQLSVL
jgi:hypothetical protein